MKDIFMIIKECARFLVCHPVVFARLTKLFVFDLGSDLSKIQGGNAEQKLDSGVNIVHNRKSVPKKDESVPKKEAAATYTPCYSCYRRRRITAAIA